MNLEEFKQVEGFPDYLISEYGIVWDIRQNKELKWIKNNDFNCVNMYNTGGKKELVKIHQAVAKTYLIKPENATKIVVHKDIDRDNNHYSNLEWKIKGVSNKALLRYSNYHGVQYHVTELEEIASKSNLPLYTIRNRLEAGYTVAEIHQGYKNSDVREYDGIVFTSLSEFSKFVQMLDEDERKKSLYLKRCEWREANFMNGVRRNNLQEENDTKRLKRGTDDEGLIKEARSSWKGMITRCYDKSRSDYQRYGAKGVTVCEEWLDFNNYCGWYIQNKITGWDLEKDILQIGIPSSEKVYSPITCCFVPRYLNQWFAKTTLPNIYQNSVGKSIKLSTHTGVFKVRKSLYGETENDLMEQWFLYKDLHMSRRFYDLKNDYDILKQSNPNLPEIHPALISVLENFSTQEYLRLRNI